MALINRPRRGEAQQPFGNLLPTKLAGYPKNKDPIMTMVLGLVTTLLMLTLGFVFGRIWEIRREMLSKQRRGEDELTRQRRAEEELLKLQPANRLSSARRWA